MKLVPRLTVGPVAASGNAATSKHPDKPKGLHVARCSPSRHKGAMAQQLERLKISLAKEEAIEMMGKVVENCSLNWKEWLGSDRPSSGQED